MSISRPLVPSFTNLTSFEISNIRTRSPSLEGDIEKKKEIVDENSKMKGDAMIEGEFVQVLVDHSKFEDFKEGWFFDEMLMRRVVA